MRNSRTESSVSSAACYLKKRHFSETEGYKKNEFKLHHSIQEMALQGIVQANSSIPNTILYGCINNDVNTTIEQYERLLCFIQNASEPYKTQLSYFLYPLFVHLYLELIFNDKRKAAEEFYNNHKKLFLLTEVYRNAVVELSKLVNSQDIHSHPYFKSFRQEKFSVSMTDDCLEYLLKYLKKFNYSFLLQIINIYFSIEPCSKDVSHLHIYNDSSFMEKTCKQLQSQKNEKNLSSGNLDALSSLKCAIKQVFDSVPYPPSAYLYTVSNTLNNSNLCTVDISSNNALLAGGFETSEIRVWSLVPKLLVSEEIEPGVSSICENQNYFNSTQCSSYPKMLQGHGGSVYSVSFTPCSEILLSCSEDTTIRAWSMKTFNNVAIYSGHYYPVWDIDVSPFALYFATASKDNTARLWTMDRAFPLRIFCGHTSDVNCIKFHPNCNYIATGSSDQTIRLWNIQDGRTVRLFAGHKGTILSLAFASNGQYLASAGEDRRIKIWDLGSGSLYKELRGHTDTVRSLCFNSDSSLLVSAGQENIIRVWDVRKNICPSTIVPDAGMECRISPELISSFSTKYSSLLLVRYSWKNCLLSFGAS